MYRIKALFCAVLFVLSGGQISLADVQSTALHHPGLRYRVENTNLNVLSHWTNPVTAQFFGLSDSDIQQHALTEILQLSNAARVDLTIVGFPNAMFAETREVSSDAQIIVMEYDPNFQPQLLTGSATQAFEAVGYVDANSHIKWILDKGLVTNAPGCLLRWKVSVDNEIEGFVLAVSSTLSLDDKRTCTSNYLPVAFGVVSAANLYDLSEIDGIEAQPDEQVIFLNRSETLFSLMSAAACREDLNNLSAACPYILIDNIIYHQMSVVKELRKK